MGQVENPVFREAILFMRTRCYVWPDYCYLQAYPELGLLVSVSVGAYVLL